MGLSHLSLPLNICENIYTMHTIVLLVKFVIYLDAVLLQESFKKHVVHS